MGAKTKINGVFGEDYTVKFLKKRGYKILERNYRSRFGEIDIIASKKGILAFVEVKTRGEKSICAPREAVDYFKQQKCIKTAEFYLVNNPSELQPRFDVSEIIVTEVGAKIEVKTHNYIENAF